MIFLFACSALSAQANRKEAFKAYCTTLTSKQLLERGRAYAASKTSVDSAVVCYSVLADRADNNKLEQDEEEFVIKGINNLGLLHFGPIFDYQKAYIYLVKAQELANRFQRNDLVLRINLNLYSLNVTSDILRNGCKITTPILDICKTSFNKALQSKDYIAYSQVLCDMSSLAIISGNTQYINSEVEKQFSQGNHTDAAICRYMENLCKGLLAYNKRNYTEALNNFLLLEKFKEDEMPNEGLLTAYILLSKAYHHIDNQDAEEDYMLKAIDKANAESNKLMLTVLYNELYSFYLHGKADKAAASKYRMLYLEAKDFLLYNSKVEKMNDKMFQSKLNEATYNVNVLYSKGEQKSKLIIFLLLAITAITILSGWIFVRLRRLKRKHLQLYEQSLKLLANEQSFIERKESPNIESELEEPVVDSKANESSKYTKSSEELAQIYQKLVEIMNHSTAIFDTDFCIQTLATMAGERQWLVSQAINQNFGNNFKAFLNSYRIKEACRRLNDVEQYQNYTIEAIAEGLGFKSRSYFVTLFKNTIGIAPSNYQKIAKEKALTVEKQL